jgi:transposase InsO family protein
VTLAAGLGTRMKSGRAKVLHAVGGAPMIHHPVALARALGATRVIAVLGHQLAKVQEALDARFGAGAVEVAEQREPLGTGHAVMQAPPRLGAGQLMRLAERVLGFRAARETLRQILIRRRDLVVELEDARRRRPRRIRVTHPGSLWGVDRTLVWLLGFWPVWLLGAVEHHGSRLVAFERLAWPTAAAVTRALALAFDEHGAPARLLTDRGPVFTSTAFVDLCAAHGVRHVLIRPGHCWTNGRIERVFRTFKQTVFDLIWFFASTREIDRYCADFRRWHNADRPHASYDGRTPDEVFFGRREQLTPLGRIDYFDGQLHWYRFG